MAEVDLSESNGGALVATAVTFLILSWFSVVLRVYVRAFMTKGFQADDWLMLVAQAIFTLSCAFILVGVHDGLGHHNVALQQKEEISALMYQALATATYVLNMLFIKLSIGFFLLRLSTSMVYNWIIYVSLAIITVWSTVIFFWNIFQCSPVEAHTSLVGGALKMETADGRAAIKPRNREGKSKKTRLPLSGLCVLRLVGVHPELGGDGPGSSEDRGTIASHPFDG